jgi:hypothetical protein
MTFRRDVFLAKFQSIVLSRARVASWSDFAMGMEKFMDDNDGDCAAACDCNLRFFFFLLFADEASIFIGAAAAGEDSDLPSLLIETSWVTDAFRFIFPIMIVP